MPGSCAPARHGFCAVKHGGDDVTGRKSPNIAEVFLGIAKNYENAFFCVV